MTTQTCESSHPVTVVRQEQQQPPSNNMNCENDNNSRTTDNNNSKHSDNTDTATTTTQQSPFFVSPATKVFQTVRGGQVPLCSPEIDSTLSPIITSSAVSSLASSVAVAADLLTFICRAAAGTDNKNNNKTTEPSTAVAAQFAQWLNDHQHHFPHPVERMSAFFRDTANHLETAQALLSSGGNSEAAACSAGKDAAAVTVGTTTANESTVTQQSNPWKCLTERVMDTQLHMLSPRGAFHLAFDSSGISMTQQQDSCTVARLHHSWIAHVIVFCQPQDCKALQLAAWSANKVATSDNDNDNNNKKRKKPVALPIRTVLITLHQQHHQQQSTIDTDTKATIIDPPLFKNKVLEKICWKWPATTTTTASDNSPVTNKDNDSISSSQSSQVVLFTPPDDTEMTLLRTSLMNGESSIAVDQWSEVPYHFLQPEQEQQQKQSLSQNDAQLSLYHFLSFRDKSRSSTTFGLPFVECISGVNAGALYPLASGLLFWKPARWIPLADIQSIGLHLSGAGGRYVTLSVDLQPQQQQEYSNNNSTNTEEKSDLSTMEIVEFTNIARQEYNVLQDYIEFVVTKLHQQKKQQERLKGNDNVDESMKDNAESVSNSNNSSGDNDDDDELYETGRKRPARTAGLQAQAVVKGDFARMAAAQPSAAAQDDSEEDDETFAEKEGETDDSSSRGENSDEANGNEGSDNEADDDHRQHSKSHTNKKESDEQLYEYGRKRPARTAGVQAQAALKRRFAIMAAAQPATAAEGDSEDDDDTFAESEKEADGSSRGEHDDESDTDEGSDNNEADDHRKRSKSNNDEKESSDELYEYGRKRPACTAGVQAHAALKKRFVMMAAVPAAQPFTAEGDDSEEDDVTFAESEKEADDSSGDENGDESDDEGSDDEADDHRKRSKSYNDEKESDKDHDFLGDSRPAAVPVTTSNETLTPWKCLGECLNQQQPDRGLQLSMISPHGTFHMTFHSSGALLTRDSNLVGLHPSWIAHVVIFCQPQDCKTLQEAASAVSSSNSKKKRKKPLALPSRTVLITLQQTQSINGGITNETAATIDPPRSKTQTLEKLNWKWPASTTTAASDNAVSNDNDSNASSSSVVLFTPPDDTEMTLLRTSLMNGESSIAPDQWSEVPYDFLQPEQEQQKQSLSNALPCRFLSFRDSSGLPFVGCSMSGVKAGALYPLASGLLFWKPARWIPLADIRSIDLNLSSGDSSKGRSVTISVVLQQQQQQQHKSNKNPTNTKTKSALSTMEIVEFTNIASQEYNVLQDYIQFVLNKLHQQKKFIIIDL